jgi:hypothetical protein
LPAGQARAPGENQILDGFVRLTRWLGAVVWLSPDELKQAGVHLGNQHY